MPIRFYCDVCHQLLKITRRKSGTWIQCPNCMSDQRVPAHSTVRKKKRHRNESPGQFSAPPVWNEEIPAPPLWNETNSENTFSPIDVLTAPVPEIVQPPVIEGYSSEFTTESDFIQAELADVEPVDIMRHDTKTVQPQEKFEHLFQHRRPRQPMSVLMVVGLASGIICFALGVLFGVCLVAPEHLHPTQTPQTGIPSEDIYVHGTLTYLDESGVVKTDSGANVFFLPVGGFREPVYPNGLTVNVTEPSLAHPNLRHIIEQGGEFVRTDSEGDFSRIMHRSGRYHLLMVSAHVTRVADSPLDEVSKDTLDKYFTDPQQLIGNAKYIFVETEIRRGVAPLVHDFGASEKGIDEIFN